MIEKGTINGTITNVDGSFTLKVSNSKATLVVSYTGYSTQEVVMSEKTIQTPVKINLAQGVELNEIVVTKRGLFSRVKSKLFSTDNKVASANASKKMMFCPPGIKQEEEGARFNTCLLYTSPSPRDGLLSRMPSSA